MNSIFKTKELFNNRFQFLEGRGSMLSKFNIHSAKIWLIEGNIRKESNVSKGMYFKIKQDSLRQFSKEIGFTDRFKNKRLSLI